MLLSGIGNFLRRDVADQIGSFITGKPAQSNPQPRPQQPQQAQQIQQQAPGGPIAPKAPQLILKSGITPQQFQQSSQSQNPNLIQPPKPNLHPTSLTKNPLVGSPSKPGPNSTMKIASATPPVKNGMNNIKINVAHPQGTFNQQQAQGTLPGHAPQTGFDKTVSNLFKPTGRLISGVASGIAQPFEEGGKALYEAGPRTIAATVSGNKVAQQHAQQALQTTSNQAINTGKGFLQFIPREISQAGLSLPTRGAMNRQITPQGGLAKFVLGNQPIESLQRSYRVANKQGGTSAGVGETTANVLGIGLAGLGAKAGISKGISLMKGKSPALPEESPAESGEPIKIASTPISERPTVGRGSGQATPEATPVTPKDVGNFLTQTTKKPEMVDTGDFTKDLETNANLTRGNYDANRLLVRNLIDNAQKAYEEDPTNFEAAYHYTEDPTIKLTPDQQVIYDNYVKPINDMATQGVNELKGSEFENAGHIPRIALDRTTKAESYLTGQSKNPTESLLRKTSNVTLKRNMKVITDEAGNRTVVSVKTPKDELGLAKGQKRVTAFREGENEDLGTFRTKSKEDLMNKEIKPLQNQLDKIQKEGNALTKVRLTGGVSGARIDALAKKGAELQFAKDEGYGLTKAEQRSLRDAQLKLKELQKVKTTKSNAPARLATINQKVLELQQLISQVEDKYNPEELNDKVFIDNRRTIPTGKFADPNGPIPSELQTIAERVDDGELVGPKQYAKLKQFEEGKYPEQAVNPNFGKRYTIGDATTKEIEANTNVRYIKNPVVTTSLAHTNVRNAINAKQFLDWMKTRPDAEEHLMKAGSPGVPDDWVSNPAEHTVNSPFFKGYFFDAKTVKVLNNLFGRENMTENIVGKAWHGLNNIATQFIVINPAIHGTNLAELADAQVSNTGLGAHPEFAANVARTLDPATRGEMIQDYLRAGGHIPNYGKEIDTVFTKAADAVGAPHLTKANATAMSAIDATFRSAAFKTNIDRGMAPDEAVRQIDTFLGKKEMVGPIARNTTLFYHYFLRTLPRALKAQITHPIKNFGSIVTTAAWFFGIQYGLNKVWQEVTGNKNAHLKLPGETGFIHDILGIPAGIKQLGEGQIPSVVSSHVAPGISIAWDQLTGKQSYSGAPVKTAGQRLTNLEQHLISPSQNVSKVMSGKSTPSEQLLNEFGFYLPHAKGAPAAPSGPLRIVNTKGAKPVLTLNAKGQKDVTGYSQETDYYNGMDKYITNGGLNTSDQNAANAFIQKTRDATGKTIMNTPGQTAANWAQLAQNPGALKAVQNFEKSQGNHNPEWDLSPQQMKVWATYHSLAPGDPERDVLAQKNSWITDKTTQEQDWINKQTFTGDVVYPPGYIKYPTIPQNVQDMMTQVGKLAAIPAANRTADQINQLKNLENNPGLQNAYQALDAYTNAERKSMGLTPINYIPNVPANVSNWSNAYEAASKEQRKVMKAQDPNMYAAMNQAYENSDLGSLEKQASIAYLSGTPSDSLLSAIYNLGTYDVNKVKNPNGTTTYSLTNFGGMPLMSSGLPVMNAVNGRAPSSSSSSSYKKSKSKPPLFIKKHPKLPKKPRIHKMKKTYLKYSSQDKGQKGGAGVKIGKAQKIQFASAKGIPVNRAKAPSSNAIKYAG